MTLVFDSNTIISAAILFNSKPATALRIAHLKFEVLISEQIIHELKDVFGREKFDNYTSLENRVSFLSNFITNCKLISVASVVTDCRDPKDNKFLELAIDGKADYIISGDSDLLVLNPFRNISIVTSARFLEIIVEEAS